MFKKLLVTAFCLLATPVLSQEMPHFRVTGDCGLASVSIKGIQTQNQKLIWFATTEDGNTYMLYRNSEKKDWYLLVASKDRPELICRLLDGLNSEVNIPKEEVKGIEN